MATANYWQCGNCGAYNATTAKLCLSCGHDPASRQIVADDACESEYGLHDQIETDLRARRWPYIHSRMDLPTTIATGAADFVIMAPGEVTLIIECKTRNGKQRPDQIAWQIQCERVGRKYYLIRSYSEYEQILVQHSFQLIQKPKT